MRTISSLGVRASRLLLVLCVLVLTGSAAAQSADDPPSTLTLDRMDSASRLGIQVGFGRMDGMSGDDGFSLRFNPYGQYLFPNRLVGVYGQLAISHIQVEGYDHTTISNLDAGAFFLPFRDSSLILRAGLTLPTASDSLDAFVTNYIAVHERLTDFALVVPESTILRLSGSTVQQSGMAFLRLDLGLDLAVDRPTGIDDIALFRANIAGGLRLNAVDLALELVNIGNLHDDGDTDHTFRHTLALGFRTHGANQFYGGLILPLDEELRGDLWFLSVGYQHRID